MIPVEVYCRRCGGFTGQHQMTDGSPASLGEHARLEDCIEALNERVKKLEAIVDGLPKMLREPV